MPERYGPWDRVYDLPALAVGRHQGEDPYRLQAEADAKGLITWAVNVDSTVCRAHQHAAGAAKEGTSRRSRPAGSSSSRLTTASDAPAAD